MSPCLLYPVDRGSLLSRKMKKKTTLAFSQMGSVVTMSAHELTKDVTAPEAEFRKRQNLAHHVTEETAQESGYESKSSHPPLPTS